jgi:hypothetical protein
MTTMLAEVYDALIAAGAPEEKARKAAEAVAGYENRFNGPENRMGRFEERMNLVQWMLGFNIALTVGVLIKLFAV